MTDERTNEGSRIELETPSIAARAQRGRSVESSIAIAIAIAIAIGWGGRKRLHLSTSNVCALRFDRARERRAGDRTKRMGLKFGTETMPHARDR